MTTNHQECFQAALPLGLTIEEELFGSEAFGHVFRVSDTRAGLNAAASRVVRFLRIDNGSAIWLEPLQGRASMLLSLQLPYVSAVRDVGSNQHFIFLLHDNHPISLAAFVRPDKGLDPRIVQSIADQLLVGLAALHRARIAHGDLRPENLFLSESPNTSSFGGQVWIADTTIGGLIYWSAGKFMPKKAVAYYPPEWNGKPQEPTPRADLYALGMLLVELLGRGTTQTAQVAEVDGKVSPSGVLAPQMRSRLPRGLRRMLDLLLAGVDDRPENAFDVQKQLRRREELVVRLQNIATGAVLVLGVVFAVLALVSSSRLRTAERTISSLSSELSVAKMKPPSPLQGPLVPPPGPVPEPTSILQATWQSKLKPDESDAAGELEALRKWYEQILETSPKDAASVQEWLKYYRALLDDAHLWFPGDLEMKQLFLKARRSPWDVEGRQKARDRLSALGKAANRWKEWAEDSDLGPQDLQAAIEGLDKPVREILTKWRGAIAGNKLWTLRLKSGRAPDGYGVYRIVSVISAGTEDRTDFDWSNPTQHDYARDPKNKKDLSFTWRPGNQIKITLEGPRSPWRVGYRPYLIEDGNTGGQLAIWLLHLKGKSKQDDFVLEYEVLDCPGPPREYFKPIDTSGE